MKKLLLVASILLVSLSAWAAKIYINPGHGAWCGNCRPMATINYAAGDTLGFFESNTNLWKALYLRDKLVAAGHEVVMSRTANGGSHYSTAANGNDKALTVIAAEAEASGANYFISIHSNAATEGGTTNYPIFLYRGYDADATAFANTCKNMASKAWTHHFDLFHSGMETCSYSGYTISKSNIRGDISFMNSYSTVKNSHSGTSYKGYYGVLKHGIPGFLVEGYFHTYQPARHRALNPDWCCQEGLRYFRGIQAYYGNAGETKGYIMGYVRTKEKQINQTYYKGRSGNDIYMPINGAKVQLRDANGTIIQTDCYPYVARKLRNQNYYTTDNNYNGVFVFSDLTPGEYTITVYKDGYADYTENLTVTADKTTYTQVFLTSGQGSSPAETSTTLNPYAYDVKAQLSQDQHRLTVSFKLNAPADVDLNNQPNKGKGVQVFIIDKTAITEKERRCDTILIPRADLLNNCSPGKEVGEYEYTINTACLPRNVDLGLEIVVHGLIHSAPVQETTYHELYCPQGVAVDTDPTSPYFGRILVTEALHDITGTAKTYLSETAGGVVKAGIYAFHPNFTPINPNGAAYNGGYNFDGTIDEYYIDKNGNVVASTATGAIKVMRSHQPWHVKISEDGRIFVSALDPRDDAIAVWELSQDLQTWTPIIQGESINANYDMLRNDQWFAGPNLSMDIVGSESNLKLLLYSVNKQGWQYDATGYRLDEYAIGTTKTAFTGKPTPITAFTKTQNGNIGYGTIHMHAKVIYDGEGGYWFASSRETESEFNLAHVNANGTLDYSNKDKIFHGGSGIMIHQSAYLDPQYSYTAQKWLFKGVNNGTSSSGLFKIFVMSKNASGAPVLTERWTVSAAGLGRYVNGYAVDYAQNLYVVGNSGEKLVAFALPYSGVTTTPYNGTFQITTTDATCTVEVETMNSAWGTVSGGGCYYVGEDVTVTATTKNGASFVDWKEGETVVTENNPYTFPAEDITLTAYFILSDSEVTWHNLFQEKQDITTIYANTNDDKVNNRLWYLFMPMFNDYFGISKTDPGTIAEKKNGTATGKNVFHVLKFLDSQQTNTTTFMTNSNSPFYWLGKYIKDVLGANETIKNNTYEWPYILHLFFNRTDQCYNIAGDNVSKETAVQDYFYNDIIPTFSTTGHPDYWRPYWTEYGLGLPDTMQYDDPMPVTWNLIDGPNSYVTYDPRNWYKWNNYYEEDKLLAWYYEEDPANPTYPENPTIVHHVDHPGALFATWVDKHIYENKHNTDVIRLMQNSNHDVAQGKQSGQATHDITVTRRLQGGMCNTICLPFDVDLSSGMLTDVNGDTYNVTAYTLTSVTDATANTPTTLNFEVVTALEAGVPYLIKPDANITADLKFTGVVRENISLETGTTKVGDRITFHGVINPTHLQDPNTLMVVANNRLALLSAEGEMLGLRAYFTIDPTAIDAEELQAQAKKGQIYLSFSKSTATDVPLAPESEKPEAPKTRKIMRDGKIYILRGEEVYDVMGRHVGD